MASEAHLHATAEAVAVEIGTTLTYPGAAATRTTTSGTQGGANGSTPSDDLPEWERLQGTVAGRGDNGDGAGTARSVNRHGEAFGLRI